MAMREMARWLCVHVCMFVCVRTCMITQETPTHLRTYGTQAIAHYFGIDEEEKRGETPGIEGAVRKAFEAVYPRRCCFHMEDTSPSAPSGGLVAKYSCPKHGRCCPRDHVMHWGSDRTVVNMWTDPESYETLTKLIDDWRTENNTASSSESRPLCRCFFFMFTCSCAAQGQMLAQLSNGEWACIRCLTLEEIGHAMFESRVKKGFPGWGALHKWRSREKQVIRTQWLKHACPFTAQEKKVVERERRDKRVEQIERRENQDRRQNDSRSSSGRLVKRPFNLRESSESDHNDDDAPSQSPPRRQRQTGARGGGGDKKRAKKTRSGEKVSSDDEDDSDPEIEHEASLCLYVGVLICHACLAIGYLFVHVLNGRDVLYAGGSYTADPHKTQSKSRGVR